MKECVNCKLNKELSCFYKDERYLYGVKSQCKTCYNLKRKEKSRVYFEKNKDKIYLKHKEYRAGAKERNLIKHKEWLNNNRDRVRKKNREYSKQRKENDLCYKLKCNLRSKISYELKNGYKSSKTTELLGCSYSFLKEHLESKFKDGMSWDNYGLKGWHIDHIKPIASFDLTNIEEQKKCLNYNNLQPLWAIDNLKKSNKYEQ